jgi:hypothetical protein
MNKLHSITIGNIKIEEFEKCEGERQVFINDVETILKFRDAVDIMFNRFHRNWVNSTGFANFWSTKTVIIEIQKIEKDCIYWKYLKDSRKHLCHIIIKKDKCYQTSIEDFYDMYLNWNKINYNTNFRFEEHNHFLLFKRKSDEIFWKNYCQLKEETEQNNSEEDICYQKFWKDIIENKDGSINLSQLKKELFDYQYILEQVPKVYCHITNNKLSFPNYSSEYVIQEYEDHIQELIKESIKENLLNENHLREFCSNLFSQLLDELMRCNNSCKYYSETKNIVKKILKKEIDKYIRKNYNI